MIYLTLFYEFFIIGLFAFGGGLATIPFLNSLSARRGWFTHALVAEMIAISEATPGPIGIKMAVYAGYTTAGLLGGLVAVFGMLFPSVFIILAVVKMLTAFNDNKYVKNAFYGLRPTVAALIASFGLVLLGSTLFNMPNGFALPVTLAELAAMIRLKQIILFTALMAAAVFIKKIQPLHLIGAAALAGVLFKL